MEAGTENNQACVEFLVSGVIEDRAAVRQRFLELAGEVDADIAFQEDSIYRRNRRLVVFDMDSTLIQTEVIDELAERAGVGDQVKAITESAMQGEIDFNESTPKQFLVSFNSNERIHSIKKKIIDDI